MQVSSYADVARLHVIYAEMEHSDGWKDYQARIQTARESVAKQLMEGTLDKFGNARDNEKRAVLSALGRMLSFPKTVHKQYESLDAKKREQEERAARKNKIHGRDVMMGAGYEPGVKARRP